MLSKVIGIIYISQCKYSNQSPTAGRLRENVWVYYSEDKGWVLAVTNHVVIPAACIFL